MKTALIVAGQFRRIDKITPKSKLRSLTMYTVVQLHIEFLNKFLNKISEHFLMIWSSVQARRQKRLAEDERFLEFQRKTESL